MEVAPIVYNLLQGEVTQLAKYNSEDITRARNLIRMYRDKYGVFQEPRFKTVLCKPHEIRSVKDLSETFNCSLAKIYKEFKKHYHITPGRYLRNLKREHALMLRKEGKPWKCIAYAIGYKSARWLYGKNLQPSKGG